MAQVPGGPIIPDLGDTLVKYNIIPGKFDMKARLNSAELVINGIKQSEGSRTLVYSKFLNDTVHSVDINYVYKDTAYNNNPYRYSYRRYAAQSARYLSDQAAIKLDLIKEGLVSDTNHISFRINEKEFVLNGVPQSPEVLQRYKNKFDPNNSPGWSWGHGTNRPIPPNN